MKEIKKRSLNELRQTKDTHYVVPALKKSSVAEEAFIRFFERNETSIDLKNLKTFLEFLDSNNYKINKH
jgi:hypothetical protein